MAAQPSLKLPEALAFHWRWPVDPLPPWIMERLDDRAIKQLAVIEVELNKDMLNAAMRATEQVLEVLGPMKR